MNKTSNIASLSLNVIDDLDKIYQVKILIEIAHIFMSKSIYVAYLKASNKVFDLSFIKTDIVTVRSYKWYDLVAINPNNDYLGDIIKIFAKNDERTEIYFIDNLNWKKFIEQQCILNHDQYKAVLVLNDNGHTFINFNLTKYNLDEVMIEINLRITSIEK